MDDLVLRARFDGAREIERDAARSARAVDRLGRSADEAGRAGGRAGGLLARFRGEVDSTGRTSGRAGGLLARFSGEMDRAGASTGRAGGLLARFRGEVRDTGGGPLRHLTSGFGALSGSVRLAGGLLGGLGGVARVGVTGAAVAIAGLTLAVGAFATSAVRSLGRIETIGAQTDAAILSTGGVANVTRGDIDALAGSLERLTSVEAESVTEGANFLLTFTNVRDQVGAGNDVFTQAVGALTDFSVATGTDATAAALQLGKALNDPVRGVTALGRAGVSFTEAQKETIRALVEGGDALSAQKIILGELETQFGGSAEALGATAVGKYRRGAHEIGTLGESIVSGFAGGAAPAIDLVLGKLEDLADRSPAWGEAIGVAVDRVVSAFGDARQVLVDYGPASDEFTRKVEEAGVALGVPAGVMDTLAGDYQRIVEALSGGIDTGSVAAVIGVLGGADAKAAADDILPRLDEALNDLGVIIRDVVGPALDDAPFSVLSVAGDALGFIADNAPAAQAALEVMLPALVAYKVAAVVGVGLHAVGAALGVIGVTGPAAGAGLTIAAGPVGLLAVTMGLLAGNAWRVYQNTGSVGQAFASLYLLIPGLTPLLNLVNMIWHAYEDWFAEQRGLAEWLDGGWRETAERFLSGVASVRDVWGELRDRAADFFERMVGFRPPEWIGGLADTLGRVAGGFGRVLGGGDGLGMLTAPGGGSFAAPGATGAAPPLLPGVGSVAMKGALNAAGLPYIVSSEVRPGSRTRSGGLSYHAQRGLQGGSRALDLDGTVGQMRALGVWIAGRYGSSTRELITPSETGLGDLRNGRPHTYSAAVKGDHSGRNSHVHWALLHGGPVEAGLSYLVGEQRDELFVGQSGAARVLAGMQVFTPPEPGWVQPFVPPARPAPGGDLAGWAAERPSPSVLAGSAPDLPGAWASELVPAAPGGGAVAGQVHLTVPVTVDARGSGLDEGALRADLEREMAATALRVVAEQRRDRRERTY